MAQHTSASFLSLAVIAAFIGASRPHIIGGSINTDFLNPGSNLLKSVISNILISSKRASVQQDTGNNVVSVNNGDQNSNPEVEDNLSTFSSSFDNQLIRVRLPSAALSGTDQVNPFTRRKRQACQMSTRMDQILEQIIRSSNTTKFIGRIPRTTQQQIPTNQTVRCPRNMTELSTRTEDRLRSNCPWGLVPKDLGNNAYPRYVSEAQCNCTNCVEMGPFYTCRPLMAKQVYLELQGCEDNLALFVKKEANITVGYFCAGPAPASTIPIYDD